jgi:hypothetical protein
MAERRVSKQLPRTWPVVLVILPMLVLGCRTINKGVTEAVLERGKADKWRIHYGSHSYYSLTDETMKQVEFAGSVERGTTTVQYQRRLENQAQCIAEITADLLAEVEARTGVAISTRSTIQLLRFDDAPENFNINLTVEPNEFPLPLFVRAGEETCAGILAQNQSYPYLLVHELVETSVATGRDRGQVLPDLSWGPFGLRAHINNYTRWFRDGLANYAGFVAYEILAEDPRFAERAEARDAVLHTRPFSALARVGTKLFSWPQWSHTRQERDYYNAALGLFLLLRDRFGEQAIRDIVAQVDTRDTVDGRDLEHIAEDVLGVELKELAGTFEFPELGVELEPVTPALALNHGVAVEAGLFVRSVAEAGAAQRAGLQPGDVITAFDARPTADELDLELALFAAREGPAATLAVRREGDGPLTLSLPLWPEPADREPGKRENPLEKGRIELWLSASVEESATVP